MNVVAVVSVALGGALGAVCRYGFSSWVGASANGAHWGILAANLLGCIAIGVARAAVDQAGWGSDAMRLFLFAGFIGSFTTFSTFESDIVVLWSSGSRVTATLYAVGSVGGGLALYWLSWWGTSSVVKAWS